MPVEFHSSVPQVPLANVFAAEMLLFHPILGLSLASLPSPYHILLHHWIYQENLDNGRQIITTLPFSLFYLTLINTAMPWAFTAHTFAKV